MSEPTPAPTAKHGLASIGGGIALAIAFFLPAVNGCGMELSMADLAKEEAAHFYVYAIAAAVALLAGFTLVAQGRRARWALLAQGLAGGLAILHLAWHVLQELGDEMQAEPLWGFWVLVAGLLAVGGQPWWSYAALGGPDPSGPKQLEVDDEPTDPGGAPLEPAPRSHLPALIAAAVFLAGLMGASWGWVFGKAVSSILTKIGHEGLSTALPVLSGIGTMIAASSGRLLSGGRAIGLGLLAGLAVAVLAKVVALTGLQGQPAYMVHGALFGLAAGGVGGLVLRSRRAMLAGAIVGALVSLGFNLIPTELMAQIDRAIGTPLHGGLRRALWWTAVLVAEAVALRGERTGQGSS